MWFQFSFSFFSNEIFVNYLSMAYVCMYHHMHIFTHGKFSSRCISDIAFTILFIFSFYLLRRNEAEFIKEIVSCVLKKLDVAAVHPPTHPKRDHFKSLVGILYTSVSFLLFSFFFFVQSWIENLFVVDMLCFFFFF